MSDRSTPPPGGDEPTDLDLVSAVIDGEATVAEVRAVDADPVLRARRDELLAAAELLRAPPPAPADSVREVHLTAALAAFDELHGDPAAPTVVSTPDIRPLPSRGRTAPGRWSRAPPAAAAAVVLLVLVVAGLVTGIGGDDTDTAATSADRSDDSAVAAAESAEGDGGSSGGDDSASDDSASDDTADADGSDIAEDTADLEDGGGPAEPATGSDRPAFATEASVVDYVTDELARAAQTSTSTSGSRTTTVDGDGDSDSDECRPGEGTGSIELVRAIEYRGDPATAVVTRAGDERTLVVLDDGCVELFRRGLNA